MNKQIPSLNGLRAFSILLVLLGHLSGTHNMDGLLPAIIGVPFGYLVDAGLGVNIFFVISGFVITTLLLKEEQAYQTVSLRSFYGRRIVRIFPAYYLVVIFYAVLQFGLHVAYFTPASWFTTLTFTKYFSPNHDWLTDHFWSLSVEEHFYLFFPFVFKYFKNYRNQVLIFSIGFVCLARFAIFYGILGNYINNFFRYDVTIFQRGDAIAIGCLIALNYKRAVNWIAAFKKYVKVPVLLCFFFIYLYKSFFLIFHLHLGPMYKLIGVGATSTFVNVCIGAIMVCSVEYSATIWYKLLNSRIAIYIGVISYSLYLWQEFFIIEKKTFIVQETPFNIIGLICVAMLSYHFIEKPFFKFKKYFVHQRTSVNTAMTTK